MYTTGPWRFIVMIMVLVSTIAPQWHRLKYVILNFNFQFGLTNDLFLYKDDISKLKYMRAESYISCLAPIFTGLLIDLSHQRLYIFMTILPAVSVIAQMIPGYDGHKELSLDLLYRQLCSFGDWSLLVCQCVLISKWYRNQISLPLAFGLLYFFTQPIIYSVMLGVWHKFLI